MVLNNLGNLAWRLEISAPPSRCSRRPEYYPAGGEGQHRITQARLAISAVAYGRLQQGEVHLEEPGNSAQARREAGIGMSLLISPWFACRQGDLVTAQALSKCIGLLGASVIRPGIAEALPPLRR